MTLPVTNASRGRSFSKLAIVKIRLKKQTESPVSDLSIERDILRKLDFISLIKEFSVGRSVPRNMWSQQLWGTHTCFCIIAVLVKAVSMCVFVCMPGLPECVCEGHVIFLPHFYTWRGIEFFLRDQ